VQSSWSLRVIALLLSMFCLAMAAAAADDSADPSATGGYRIQPGDQLAITVWGEAELTTPVIVRPDGALSFPLVGDLGAAGRTPTELADALRAGLTRFLPDPIVTVAVTRADGNVVYVIGKVNRPGAFAMARPTDVMQALTLAGGLDPFADADDILVLRQQDGQTQAIRFDFTEAARGRALERNIALRPGDVVVVP
jgi:polysaccharide export outer membrane protein